MKADCSMENIRLHAGLSVAQVLKAYPQASHVFIVLKTDCVGCYMMDFCSLGEVARQYDLRPEDMLAELQKAIETA